ncbi:ribosomal protein S18-alanine N-acetyltransferase [Cetobacterium sp. 2A]|uniref:ribosomal protein S18-alanine N-acetyltransferase n=1 Tax=Cetobacterium sp. 2A TaxID=2754723 RepID=UPI001C8DC48C|nr:ribosomal protein S18-alanine N-acetyltransferase [Cetobacterium sp. 2A]
MIERLKKDENLLNLVELENEIFLKSSYTLEQLKDMILDDNYIIYIYKLEEEIVGYLILHDSFDVYEIMKIGTKNSSRGLGIGRNLISKYLDEYNKDLFLEVRESNLVARNFYKKLNFKEVGIRKKYYSDNDESAILMLLERK